MDGPQKLKIALDETRMLVLGAEVLLGFQLRGAFQDGFEALPAASKALDATALLLMTLVVGLLIAPAIHHRIVDGGDGTGRIFRAISALMAIALVPFAFSLGINVFIVVEHMASSTQAILAALAVTAIALWFWFGMALLSLRDKGSMDMKVKDESVPLPNKIDQMLTEARVIVPGVQALLGFQLSVVITQSFDKLPPSSKAIHALALGFVVLSTILLMAPAAYHRIVYGGEASRAFLTLGSRFLMGATIVLALGLSADVYVVVTKIAESNMIGVAAAAVSLIALVSLWHISPLVLRSRIVPQGVQGNDAQNATFPG